MSSAGVSALVGDAERLRASGESAIDLAERANTPPPFETSDRS